MDRVSIGATIAASFGNIAPAWRKAPAILAIAVVFQAGLAAARLVTSPGAMLLLSLAGALVGLFVGTAVLGALYRAGIGPDHGRDPEFSPGPGGLQWGGLEWRVLGANVLLGLFYFIIVFVAAIIWGIGLVASLGGDTSALTGFSAAAGTAAQMAALMHLMAGPAGIVTVVVALPTTGFAIWLFAKLGVFVVMAADTRSFSLGQAWTLTRGAVWALIVTGVIVFVVEILIGVGFGAAGGLLDGLTGHGASTGRTWAGVVAQGVGAAVNAPLAAGMQVFVYRAKHGGAANVAATFA